MPYKYGTGSLSVSCLVSASILNREYNGPLIDDPETSGLSGTSSAEMECTFGPYRATLTPFKEQINSQPPNVINQTRTYKCGYIARLSNAPGEVKLYAGSVTLPYALGSYASYGGTVTTTFQVQLPTDRLREYTSNTSSIIDAPLGRTKLTLFEAISQTVESAATFGGLSAGGLYAPGATPDYTLSCNIVAGATFGASGAWSVALPEGFSTTDTGSFSGTYANGTVSGGYCHLEVSAASDHEIYGYLNTQNAPPKAYTMEGVVRAMEQAYPDALMGTCSKFAGDTHTDFAISGGGFGLGYSQRKARLAVAWSPLPPSANAGTGSVGFADVNEWQPLSCGIQTSSLSAVGDDPRATRLLFRGSRFAGIGLSHAASVLIDDCAALTKTGNWAGQWQAVGSGTAPAAIGGGIGFTGSVKRAFTHEVSLSSYRYLNVRVKSAVANAPITVSIGGKSWSGKTGAVDTFTDVKLDLCAEQNQSATTSTDDAKWPLEQHDEPTIGGGVSVVSDGLPVSEKVYFGVGRCASITLSGAAGTAFIVSRVELVRDAALAVTYMPAFYRGEIVPSGSGDGEVVDEPWPVNEYPTRTAFTEGGGTSDYYARRFLLANVDGRQGLEEKDSYYIFNSPPSGASSVSPNQQSIKNLVDSINAANVNGVLLNPGWAATSLKSAPVSGCDGTYPAFDPCYLNENLPAVFLFGGGMMALADGTWRYGFDQTTLGTDAQELFDEVDWFPGCGNVFGFGAATTDGSIVLRIGTTLRSAAHGLALTSAKQPSAGKTVELRQGTPDSIVSWGVSGENGYYKTSAVPFAKTVQGATGKLGNRTADFTAYGRKRQRVVFVIAGQTFYGPLAIDSPRQYLHAAEGKKIATYHLANAALAWESAEHPVDEWVHLCFDTRRGAALFALGKTDESAFSLFRSRDGGQTLTEILSVIAKTAATEKDSERGWIIVLFSDPSDAVFRKVSRDGGVTWDADEPVSLTGDVLDLCQDARAAGVLLLTFRDTVNDTMQVLKSKDAGLHWSVLLSGDAVPPDSAFVGIEDATPEAGGISDGA